MVVTIRRPFFVLQMAEAETLDDIDAPIIAYASPSMCNLLGYDHVRHDTTHAHGQDS
jgi:hypothetical protein